MLRLVAALRRAPALAASVAVHAGAIAAGGHVLSTSKVADVIAIGVADAEIPVDLAPPPAAPEGQPEIPLAGKSTRSFATHHHSYPVAPDHDARPHDPSIVHLPFAPAAPIGEALPHVEAVTSEEAPAQFVLAKVPAVSRAPTSGEGGAVGGAPGVGGAENGTFDERQVNVPARLVASVTPEYPAEALAAQVETDCKLELRIDDSGRVVDARSLSATGYGFEAAALRAVRSFRFSPALREGRPVSVRMRWTVSFRLD
jgi:TonB family protein